MGTMRPKPAALGTVDLAFMVFHGKLVAFPGTGYEAYMVEVEQEVLTAPDGMSIGPPHTGTLLYIYNIPPDNIRNLKEVK